MIVAHTEWELLIKYIKVKWKTDAYGKDLDTIGLLTTMMSGYYFVPEEMSSEMRTNPQSNVII